MKCEKPPCFYFYSLAWLNPRVEKRTVGLEKILFFLVFFGLMNGILGAHHSWAAGNQAEISILPPGSTSESAITVNSMLMEANRLLQVQKWNDAGALFRSVLKREPQSIQGAIGLAATLAHSKKREEGLNILSSCLTGVTRTQRAVVIRRIHVLARTFLSNDTFRMYQDALNLMLEKKYRAAKEKFVKALAEEPDNVEILLRLGQCFFLDNDITHAISRLQAAQKLDPYEPMINLWLGRALFIRGSHAEAIAELKTAQHGLQGCEQSTVWLAEALSSSGQNYPAIRLLDRDSKSWPFHVSSLIALAKLRVQSPHPDSQLLWTARKELQLAMSRVEQYFATDPSQVERELSLDLRKSSSEIKSEIQKLLQLVQSRIDENNSHR
jgi:tetratricopeptide (TPR) repeat protein